MAFKFKIGKTWYNGYGQKIRRPKAYAYAMYGRPYKVMWKSSLYKSNTRKKKWYYQKKES